MPKTPNTAEAVETVEVSKDKLDAILAKQEAQDKEIEILRDSVSRGRLEEAEDKRKDKELPKAYLKVFQGKVVTSWKSTAAKIVHNPTTGLSVGEVLQATYSFLDGTDSGVVEQTEFTRTEEREYVRLLNSRIEFITNPTTNMMEPVTFYTAKFENPALLQDPFEINAVFLNP